MDDGDATSERALLRAWADGDVEAGNALVARHFSGLYGFFRSKLRGEIDDLIQRTFESCVRTRARLRDDGSFRAYMFAVARNELYAELRGRMSKPIDDIGASRIDALADSGALPEPSRLADRAEQILLLRALRRLPLDDQIMVELFYWKALSAAEIGEVFELTASAVRTKLQRTRARLEGLIAELSHDAQLVESTVDGFERWSASLDVQRPG